jgi:predicted RNase H-like nuclease (RuvC/YqgF family)
MTSRAERLSQVLSALEEAKESAVSEIQNLKEELENWRDNMPESLQGGSKYDELEEAINELDNLESELDGTDIPSGDDVNFPGMM